MKKVILIICVLFLQLTAVAAPLSDEMQIFLQSSHTLNKGIAARDKSLVTDAAEGFSLLNFDELAPEDFSIITSHPEAIGNPEIQYRAEFCDSLRRTDFVIVERDPIPSVRKAGIKSDDINIISRSIMPQSEATFILFGEGEIELGVPASGQGLIVTLTSDGNEIPVIIDPECGFPTSQWHANPDADIRITISNPGSEKISFGVALK